MKRIKICLTVLFSLSALMLGAAVLLAVQGSLAQQETARIKSGLDAQRLEVRQLTASAQEKKTEQDGLKQEADGLSGLPERLAALKREYFANVKRLEDQILAGKSGKKIAYLTFDDGPYDLTADYLKVLDQYGVRATFFLLGKPNHAEYYPQYAAKGHTIANHTYSHQIKNGVYRSPQAFLADVLKQQAFVEQLTGVTTDIVRFPGGSPTAGTIKEACVEQLRAHGYGYVDWTAWDGDGFSTGAPNPDKAYETLMKTVEGDKLAVVLMHDYNAVTLKALPRMIEGLREKGYMLLPLFKDSNMVKK